jgi:hypothetical protein
MPGQYPTRGAFRPRLCDDAQEADATARLFLCARCRAQVLICSCCDRGNIYCGEGCAEEIRRGATPVAVLSSDQIGCWNCRLAENTACECSCGEFVYFTPAAFAFHNSHGRMTTCCWTMSAISPSSLSR